MNLKIFNFLVSDVGLSVTTTNEGLFDEALIRPHEPSSKEILDRLLKRYIETQIYQAVIENNACEQAAKMIAMKNASENAEEIINDLQLLYNNARQASITQELSEIVGGAAAI